MKRLLILAAFVSLHAQDCPSGRYCVTVGVKAGALARTSAAQPLDAAIDTLLAKLPKPYQLTLTPEDLAKDTAGTFSFPGDALTAVRTGSGTILEYFPTLQVWCDAYQQCQSSADNVLSVVGIFQNFATFQDEGFLFNVDSDVLTVETGSAIFRLAPDFDAEEVTILTPASSPADAAHRIKNLRNWLKTLNKIRWNRTNVNARVLAFYSALGLDLIIESSIEENSINIIEGTRLESIVFPFGLPVKNQSANWDKVDQALYSALPDAAFRSGYLSRRDANRTKLEANSAPSLSLATDLGIPLSQSPFISRVRLPIQQLLLQQGGFSLGVTTPALKLAGTVLNSLASYRLEDIAAAPPLANAVTPAPSATDGNGHITPTAATLLPAQAPPIKFAPDGCIDDPGQKPKTRYAGFGVAYRPGQGIRFFGLGQQNFSNSGLSTRIGQGGPGTALATVNFSTDYVAFSRFHRRLALSVQGGTDSEANRYLAGGKINEQRTGVRARAELELFRDRRGHLLKFFTEAARTKVTLAEVSYTNTLDLGAVHTYESSGTPYPWTWRFEPTLRWGVATATVQQHQRASAVARFHKTLPRGFAADIGTQAAFASVSTPLFDRPSLGGADSLRGFRHDDAIATRLWTLQPELWAPIRNNIKLALFNDLGNAGDLSAPPRSGPGVGIRFLAGPAVLRADWAYGFGPAVTGGSRGKFYFSVTTNLPF